MSRRPRVTHFRTAAGGFAECGSFYHAFTSPVRGSVTCKNCKNTRRYKVEGRKVVATKKGPPLGLVPESIWIRRRMTDIVSAMDRYNDAGMHIPREWFAELEDHQDSLEMVREETSDVL